MCNTAKESEFLHVSLPSKFRVAKGRGLMLINTTMEVLLSTMPFERNKALTSK